MVPPGDTTKVASLLGADAALTSRAADSHFQRVYHDLRDMADRFLAREPAGGTLSATALVHEAYLRLLDEDGVKWGDRAYFFGTAARAMRRILVERAIRRGAAKRGGGCARIPMEAAQLHAPDHATDWLGLDDELRVLEAQDPRAHQIVMLRVFAGLGVRDTAELLGVSAATVKREWAYARAWLNDRLLGGGAPPANDDP